jgi:hypothetical protein
LIGIKAPSPEKADAGSSMEEHRMKNPKPGSNAAAAAPQDVERLLGELDAATLAAIMALKPSLAEVEAAALWSVGEGESLPERHQPRRIVEAILDLVAVDEDEDRRIS